MKRLILIMIAMAIFFACANDTSVFRTIMEDEPELDHNLDNTTTIIGMGHDSTNGRYIISTSGKMWARPVSQTGNDIEWTEIAMPANAQYCTAFIIPTGTTTLYAGFINNKTEGEYTFSFYSVDLTTAATWSASLWSAISDTDVAGKQITGLWYVNSNLFVSVQETGGSYSLYYGATYDSTNIADIANPVIDMTYDDDGTTYYYAITEDNIYQSTLITGLNNTNPLDHNITLANDTTTNLTLYGKFRGIYFASDNNLYVSESGGQIHKSTDDGSNWSSTDLWGDDDDDTKIVDASFTKFTETTDTMANDILLVGSYNKGFYRIPLPAGSVMADDIKSMSYTSDAEPTAFQLSALNNSTVIGFFNYHEASPDTDDDFTPNVPYDNIFFCTAGDGLIWDTYDGTNWGNNWDHE